jgi:hypothetical protein
MHCIAYIHIQNLAAYFESAQDVAMCSSQFTTPAITPGIQQRTRLISNVSSAASPEPYK